jgi:hypothetical protein
MSGHIPRVVMNDAQAINTNTIHSIFTRKAVDLRVLTVSFYNTLTMLSAELCGRSYGGGVLKLETKEAEKLCLIDIKETSVEKELNRKFSDIDKLVRSRHTHEALKIVDEVLLEEYLGLSPIELKLLRKAYRSVKRVRYA